MKSYAANVFTKIRMLVNRIFKNYSQIIIVEQCLTRIGRDNLVLRPSNIEIIQKKRFSFSLEKEGTDWFLVFLSTYKLFLNFSCKMFLGASKSNKKLGINTF